MTSEPKEYRLVAADTSRDTPLVTEQYTTNITPNAGPPGLPPDADIEDAVMDMFMVLSEDAETDMRSMLAQMQADRAARRKHRQLYDQLNQERTRAQGHAGYSALVAEAQQVITAQLDSMDELSQLTSLRLQMAMDRRSKMLSALSNLLKKMSATENAIIQNMK